MLFSAVIGAPLLGSLSAGGYADPESQSSRATKILEDEFGKGTLQLIFTVSSDQGAHSASARNVGLDIVKRLKQSPSVADVTSTWTVPDEQAAAMTSRDGSTGIVIAGLHGNEDDAQKSADALAHELTAQSDNVTVRAGGTAMMLSQLTSQSARDLLRVEIIVLPLATVVLVWIFGGLVAASLPLLVSTFAILGSLATLRVIALVTEVHVFALNTTVAMGFALAVDYTLLIISRFRDELRECDDRDTALTRTVTSAGRTVIFSAAIVALTMATLAIFPMYVLRSFAYASVATVMFAVIAAVIVAPAALALIGPRLDSLNVFVLLRNRKRQEDTSIAAPQSFWYTWARRAMRHAVPAALVVTALLLAMGVPFLSARWGAGDDRILPDSASARQVGDLIRGEFPVDPASQTTIVVPHARAADTDIENYARQLSRVADVAAVESPLGTFMNGTRPTLSATERSLSGAMYFVVTTTAPLYSDKSASMLAEIQRIPGPSGQDVLLGGAEQVNQDMVNSLASRMPIALFLIAVVTFIALSMVTGSVVIPITAIIFNALSLIATFGLLVWIFQDGHLGGLGTASTGTLVASVLMLLFCVAFSLSTDYEVFLVARIREFWVASGRTRSDADNAIAQGIAHTGRVITAAALLMAVAFGSLVVSQVVFLKMYGFGLMVAVLLDATLVRMVLVPAVMHLLGPRSWWGPQFLDRLDRRRGEHAASSGAHSLRGPNRRSS